MPCYHKLEQFLDEYRRRRHRRRRGGSAVPHLGRPLGQAHLEHHVSGGRVPHDTPQGRAGQAGVKTKIGNHTFRATGITAYLKNGGTLEMAQHIANHELPRTTKLYDRRVEEISLDEVERITL